MLWTPTDSDEVVKLALPLPPAVPVPSTVSPSLKVALPVGELPITCMVNVTGWPTTAGLAVEVMLQWTWILS